MPQVTQLSPQKKLKRFNLYLEGRYVFSVSEFTILKNNLKVGKNLTQEQVDLISSKEKSSGYLDLALRYLSVRPRSEKEIQVYLQKKIAEKEGIKFSELKDSPIIEKIVNKLRRYDYINDKNFAEWFAKSRLNSRHYSIKLIKYELQAKGIAKNILENLKFPKAGEKKNAIEAVEKKVKRWQSLSPIEFKKKFFQFLAYRGFDFETIGEAFAFYLKKR